MEMTASNNCLTVGFDGTAALKPSPRAHLVLIEGGRRPVRGRRPSVTPLTFGQSCLLVLVGVLLVGALGLAAAVSGALSAASLEQTLSELPERELVVRDGDSLWSIAESLEVEDVATADVVSWISERNGLSDALLVAGQRLTVPSPDLM